MSDEIERLRKELRETTSLQIKRYGHIMDVAATLGLGGHIESMPYAARRVRDSIIERDAEIERLRSLKDVDRPPVVPPGDFAEALRDASGMEPGGSQVYAPIYWDDVAAELLAKFDIRPKPEGETP